MKREATTRSKRIGVEDRYLDLVRRFPLRPLRNGADLDAAVEMIDSLLDQSRLSQAEQDYLDVLSDLVESYENEHVSIRPAGDADLLRFLMEQKGVTQAAVAAESGIAESTISEVLTGKRELNRTQIVKLSRYFHIEPGAFLTVVYTHVALTPRRSPIAAMQVPSAHPLGNRPRPFRRSGGHSIR
jgi:HTH-type transcriptional regulator/antitoxin HigA